MTIEIRTNPITNLPTLYIDGGDDNTVTKLLEKGIATEDPRYGTQGFIHDEPFDYSGFQDVTRNDNDMNLNGTNREDADGPYGEIYLFIAVPILITEGTTFVIDRNCTIHFAMSANIFKRNNSIPLNTSLVNTIRFTKGNVNFFTCLGEIKYVENINSTLERQYGGHDRRGFVPRLTLSRSYMPHCKYNNVDSNSFISLTSTVYDSTAAGTDLNGTVVDLSNCDVNSGYSIGTLSSFGGNGPSDSNFSSAISGRSIKFNNSVVRMNLTQGEYGNYGIDNLISPQAADGSVSDENSLVSGTYFSHKSFITSIYPNSDYIGSTSLNASSLRNRSRTQVQVRHGSWELDNYTQFGGSLNFGINPKTAAGINLHDTVLECTGILPRNIILDDITFNTTNKDAATTVTNSHITFGTGQGSLILKNFNLSKLINSGSHINSLERLIQFEGGLGEIDTSGGGRVLEEFGLFIGRDTIDNDLHKGTVTLNKDVTLIIKDAETKDVFDQTDLDKLTLIVVDSGSDQATPSEIGDNIPERNSANDDWTGAAVVHHWSDRMLYSGIVDQPTGIMELSLQQPSNFTSYDSSFASDYLSGELPFFNNISSTFVAPTTGIFTHVISKSTSAVAIDTSTPSVNIRYPFIGSARGYGFREYPIIIDENIINSTRDTITDFMYMEKDSGISKLRSEVDGWGDDNTNVVTLDDMYDAIKHREVELFEADQLDENIIDQFKLMYHDNFGTIIFPAGIKLVIQDEPFVGAFPVGEIVDINIDSTSGVLRPGFNPGDEDSEYIVYTMAVHPTNFSVGTKHTKIRLLGDSIYEEVMGTSTGSIEIFDSTQSDPVKSPSVITEYILQIKSDNPLDEFNCSVYINDILDNYYFGNIGETGLTTPRVRSGQKVEIFAWTAGHKPLYRMFESIPNDSGTVSVTLNFVENQILNNQNINNSLISVDDLDAPLNDTDPFTMPFVGIRNNVDRTYSSEISLADKTLVWSSSSSGTTLTLTDPTVILLDEEKVFIDSSSYYIKGIDSVNGIYELYNNRALTGSIADTSSIEADILNAPLPLPPVLLVREPRSFGISFLESRNYPTNANVIAVFDLFLGTQEYFEAIKTISLETSTVPDINLIEVTSVGTGVGVFVKSELNRQDGPQFIIRNDSVFNSTVVIPLLISTEDIFSVKSELLRNNSLIIFNQEASGLDIELLFTLLKNTEDRIANTVMTTTPLIP